MHPTDEKVRTPARWILYEEPHAPVVEVESPPVVLVESPPVVLVESPPVVVTTSLPGVSHGVLMMKSKRMDQISVTVIPLS